jgi:hypothetical protein
MNNLADVEKALLKEVGVRLEKYGFSAKPVGQSFRMPKPFGWAAVQPTFVRHPGLGLDVILNVALRIEAVQERIQGNDPLVSAKDRKNSATIGCEFGNLTEGGQHRWSVARVEDVPAVAESIVAASGSVLLPFIEKYSDLGVLLRELERSPEFARLVVSFADKRARVIDALNDLLNDEAR